MIKLTKTMLEKSIIDCNAACREVALSAGVDFAAMAPGDRMTVPAVWTDYTGQPLEDSEVRFYRTNNARGDRRISIKGIRQKAEIGNIVHLYFENGVMLLGVEK